MSSDRYILGLDLGQAQDYTAAVILQAFYPERSGDVHCHVRHIRRYPLRTPYPDIVTDVAKTLQRPPLAGCGELVVDATGTGRPVVDMLSRAGAWPLAVTITAGTVETQDLDGYKVPKRDLVSVLAVLMQTGRLKSAALHEWPLLEGELLNFQVKISTDTGNDSYGAWREGKHDDLVLALALACWHASRPLPFVVGIDDGFAMGPHWSSLVRR